MVGQYGVGFDANIGAGVHAGRGEDGLAEHLFGQGSVGSDIHRDAQVETGEISAAVEGRPDADRAPGAFGREEKIFLPGEKKLHRPAADEGGESRVTGEERRVHSFPSRWAPSLVGRTDTSSFLQPRMRATESRT